MQRLRMLHRAIVEREEHGERLSRLLPGGLAEQVRQGGRRIGETEMLDVTVLMSDVRGYSAIAEDADLSELARQLNAHRAEMTQAITEAGGTVMQFVGDAVMGVFGAPLPQRDHAARALAAASDMHARQSSLNAGWQAERLRPFPLGIGLSTGTGAARGDVWVKSGSELRLAASWPESPQGMQRRLGLEDGRLPDFPSTDRAVPVRHQDELLGALAVVKPRGEALTPAEDKLLNDLAAQAGLVLRNVGLTAELLARLDDLRASRQRLVSAQDEERRRLERNLHDGAQQHLVGLRVKLNLAARQTDDARLREALVALQADAEEAVEALRDLARGIYPPLLAEEGLAAALEAHARKSPLKVEIATDGVARHPQDLEAAVYFCCLEAVQNVAKYADGARAVVHLSEADGQLRFVVSDDGAGFDPVTTARGSGLQNMADRVEALGGALAVTSEPGSGTTVAGRVPSRAVPAAENGPPAAPAVGIAID